MKSFFMEMRGKLLRFVALIFFLSVMIPISIISISFVVSRSIDLITRFSYDDAVIYNILGINFFLMLRSFALWGVIIFIAFSLIGSSIELVVNIFKIEDEKAQLWYKTLSQVLVVALIVLGLATALDDVGFNLVVGLVSFAALITPFVRKKIPIRPSEEKSLEAGEEHGNYQNKKHI